MKSKIAFLLILISLFFASCSKKPENHESAAPTGSLNPVESAESVEQIDDKEEEPEKYVDIAAAKEQIKELAGNDYLGFIVPSNMILPENNEVFDMELAGYYCTDGEFYYNATKGICPFIEEVKPETADNVIDRTYDNVINSGNKMWQYFVQKGNIWYGWMSIGSIGASRYDNITFSDIIKQYDFLWGDKVEREETYELDGKQVSLLEMSEFTEKVVNEYFAPTENNEFEYKVQHAAVSINSETGRNNFVFSMGRIYKGIPMDTCSNFNKYQADYEKNNSGRYILAVMDRENELAYFNAPNCNLKIKESVKKETVISPKYALYLMNKEIAHAGRMGFAKGGLLYLETQEVYKSYHLSEGMIKSEIVGEVNDGVCKTEMHPFWAFYQESREKGFNTNSGIRDSHGISILVDAIDGSVYYYPNTGVY